MDFQQSMREGEASLARLRAIREEFERETARWNAQDALDNSSPDTLLGRAERLEALSRSEVQNG